MKSTAPIGTVALPDWMNADLHWATPRNPVPQVHNHEWHELLLVRKGVYAVDIGRTTVRLGHDEALYYPPGLKHRPRVWSGGYTQFYVLMWRGGDGAGLPVAPVKVRDVSGRLSTALAWTWELHLNQHPCNLAAAQGLWLTIREEMKSLAHSPSDVQRVGPVGVVRYLMQSLMDLPLSLSDLSACVGLDTAQLTRRFRRETGLPPMQYLQHVRLNMVARLLLTTELPLKAIVQRTGLGSSAYLCRLFRRAYGKSPVKYRNSLLGAQTDFE